MSTAKTFGQSFKIFDPEGGTHDHFNGAFYWKAAVQVHFVNIFYWLSERYKIKDPEGSFINKIFDCYFKHNFGVVKS
jgi:hypothetical protein